MLLKTNLIFAFRHEKNNGIENLITQHLRN